ncbi:MAG: FAD-dependent oxidoreductase [Bradyrhizobium sp.]
MTAALELRKAGYRVQILEFNSRAGGRNWTLAGRRFLHRTRRRHPDLRVRRRSLSQSRPMADSTSPPRGSGLLPASRCGARAVQPAQPQCLPARPPALLGAHRSAFVTSKPIFRARFPNCWPR